LYHFPSKFSYLRTFRVTNFSNFPPRTLFLMKESSAIITGRSFYGNPPGDMFLFCSGLVNPSWSFLPVLLRYHRFFRSFSQGQLLRFLSLGMFVPWFLLLAHDPVVCAFYALPVGLSQRRRLCFLPGTFLPPFSSIPPAGLGPRSPPNLSSPLHRRREFSSASAFFGLPASPPVQTKLFCTSL